MNDKYAAAWEKGTVPFSPDENWDSPQGLCVHKLSVGGRQFVGRPGVIDNPARHGMGPLGCRDAINTPATGGGQVFPNGRPSRKDKLTIGRQALQFAPQRTTDSRRPRTITADV